MPRELQILQDCYDLTLDLTKRILKFPRNIRYGLGLIVERRVQEVQASLIRAKYAPAAEKLPILHAVNVELEILRFQLREAAELGALPANGHEFLCKQVDAIGRQVGGWIKSLGGGAAA